jgi:hypothetical protein
MTARLAVASHLSASTWALSFLALLASIVSGCATTPPLSAEADSNAEPVSSAPAVPVGGPPASDTSAGGASLHVAAVGDIMLGTDYPDSRLAEDDGVGLLAGAAETLRSADIAFGNLEGVLLDGGEPHKRCSSGACYVFRSPSRYAERLRAAGFDVLSVANNHARDFGEEGRTATMQALDAAGIRHSGRAGTLASWVVADRRVALLAFAPFGGSNSMLDIDAAAAQVQAASTTHDVVIVSFHGGAEGEGNQRVPFATEHFHGEDRGDVVHFARAMVDAGADLLIGHGPHVPRAVELYRDRLIAYSLGNFSTYFGIKVTGDNGTAPLLVAEIGPDGRFVSGRIESYRQVRPHGPRQDLEHRAARLIKYLTEQDFPDTAVRVTDDGDLYLLARQPIPPPAVTATAR